VYSTNSDFDYSANDGEEESLENNEQNLRVHLDRKKGNKLVSRITGFVGSDDDLKALGKSIKAELGTGGTAKNGEILIQGDFRDRIIASLKSQGYPAKKSGG